MSSRPGGPPQVTVSVSVSPIRSGAFCKVVLILLALLVLLWRRCLEGPLEGLEAGCCPSWDVGVGVAACVVEFFQAAVRLGKLPPACSTLLGEDVDPPQDLLRGLFLALRLQVTSLGGELSYISKFAPVLLYLLCGTRPAAPFKTGLHADTSTVLIGDFCLLSPLERLLGGLHFAFILQLSARRSAAKTTAAAYRRGRKSGTFACSARK